MRARRLRWALLVVVIGCTPRTTPEGELPLPPPECAECTSDPLTVSVPAQLYVYLGRPAITIAPADLPQRPSLTFDWRYVSQPAGAAHADATGQAALRFDPDVRGRYVVEVTAHGDTAVASAKVAIDVIVDAYYAVVRRQAEDGALYRIETDGALTRVADEPVFAMAQGDEVGRGLQPLGAKGVVYAVRNDAATAALDPATLSAPTPGVAADCTSGANPTLSAGVCCPDAQHAGVRAASPLCRTSGSLPSCPAAGGPWTLGPEGFCCPADAGAPYAAALVGPSVVCTPVGGGATAAGDFAHCGSDPPAAGALSVCCPSLAHVGEVVSWPGELRCTVAGEMPTCSAGGELGNGTCCPSGEVGSSYSDGLSEQHVCCANRGEASVSFGACCPPSYAIDAGGACRPLEPSRIEVKIAPSGATPRVLYAGGHARSNDAACTFGDVSASGLTACAYEPTLVRSDGTGRFVSFAITKSNTSGPTPPQRSSFTTALFVLDADAAIASHVRGDTPVDSPALGDEERPFLVVPNAAGEDISLAVLSATGDRVLVVRQPVLPIAATAELYERATKSLLASSSLPGSVIDGVLATDGSFVYAASDPVTQESLGVFRSVLSSSPTTESLFADAVEPGFVRLDLAQLTARKACATDCATAYPSPRPAFDDPACAADACCACLADPGRGNGNDPRASCDAARADAKAGVAVPLGSVGRMTAVSLLGTKVAVVMDVQHVTDCGHVFDDFSHLHSYRVGVLELASVPQSGLTQVARTNVFSLTAATAGALKPVQSVMGLHFLAQGQQLAVAASTTLGATGEPPNVWRFQLDGQNAAPLLPNDVQHLGVSLCSGQHAPSGASAAWLLALACLRVLRSRPRVRKPAR